MLRCLLGLAMLVVLNPVFAAYSIDKKMDEATARAFLVRFGFGANTKSLNSALKLTPQQYIALAIRGESRLPDDINNQIQLMPISQPLEPLWGLYGLGGSERAKGKDKDARLATQKAVNDYFDATIRARLLTMANSDNQGHESLLSFWLNHFSVYGPNDSDNKLLDWDYSNAIEKAMKEDSFEALLRASFYHPAMQTYLGNAQSTAPSSSFAVKAATRGVNLGINENLAREVMELHTMGVGSGYTQNDVQELARIITGAGVYNAHMQPLDISKAGATKNGLFLFDPRRHDFGSKKFLNQDFPAGQGLGEIDRVLHILASHPATAHHIALKLASKYLSDNPPKALVQAMTDAYMRSGGRISATLLPLISSPEFAASLASPTKFKEPVDYIISSARLACDGAVVGNGQALSKVARDMGQSPFMHTTPDGYGVLESDWLSPAAMAKRVRFANDIANVKIPLGLAPSAAEVVKPVGDMNSMVMDQPMGSAEINAGINCQPTVATFEQFISPLSTSTKSAEDGLEMKQKVALLLSSPEFMRR